MCVVNNDRCVGNDEKSLRIRAAYELSQYNLI